MDFELSREQKDIQKAVQESVKGEFTKVLGVIRQAHLSGACS